MYLPLFLFILFFSLHVCTARPLVEEACITHINISGKVSENAKKQPLESNGATDTEDHIKVKDTNIGAVREERRLQHMKSVHDLNALESTDKQRKISGHVPIKSVVNPVSWSVPHGKQGQNPGYYSDYSRPRTRPPSHN